MLYFRYRKSVAKKIYNIGGADPWADQWKLNHLISVVRIITATNIIDENIYEEGSDLWK